MDNKENIIIVSCSSCGARFKIRNPQPGAEFPCNRCQNKIIISEDAAKSSQDAAKSSQDAAKSSQPQEETTATSQKKDTSSSEAQKIPQSGTKTVSNKEAGSSESNKVSDDIASSPKSKPEIVKIELHKSSFQREGEGAKTSESVNAKTSRMDNATKAISREDALQITDKGSSRFTKKIFASDIQNRERLLYMISLYSKPGANGEKGIWLRKLPLQVFMFEGVVNEIFDWDYAPASICTAEGRSFLNISQEGEEDLFALLADEYVYTLKLSTSQHRNIAAYQISNKGAKYVEKIGLENKKVIVSLVQCPKCRHKMDVFKKGDAFFMVCPKAECGYEKRSTITDAEDVSYFCIPYFPSTLASFDYVPPTITKSRLSKYFQSNPRDNIKDTLEELIYLSNAKVMIGEWIPFGSNHLAALNYKLGSNERVQSAKFTQELDMSPDATTVAIPESLTLVKVRDYSLASYVDFEAMIYLPEDPQIIQVEEFGVHIDFTGAVRYGLEILAMNERDKSKLSLDHLPRVLVDIVQDSTTIMDTLLTGYQKSLLELIFQNTSRYRDKYFFIVANELHCFEHQEEEQSSTELMRILSQANYQDELNQVTEEVKETALFADGTVLILGSHGSILVTRTPDKYEQLISDFLFTMDMELFLNNFFARLFLMNDELKDIKHLIKSCETDPTAIATVQHKLSQTSGDAILMEEIRSYLDEAISLFRGQFQEHCSSYPKDMKEAVQTFRIQEMVEGLTIRIRDIQKIVNGTQQCLQGLTRVTEVISERQMRRIQETLSNNTRSLEDMTKTNERSGMSLRILEIIMAGSLAFNIMDEFSGQWEMSNNPLRHILQTIFDIPGMWLACCLGLWSIFGFAIFFLMRWLEDTNAKALAIRIKLDLACDIDALRKFLAGKDLMTHDADIFNVGNFIKVAWEENDKAKWLGNTPKMEVVYDEKNGYLLSALIEVSRPTRQTTSEQLRKIFLAELKKANIFAK